MKLQDVPTRELAGMAARYNPRRISEDKLDALGRSLKTFGVLQPVIVNRKSKTIIGGHQRVRAAADQGIEKLPVLYVDLDEAQEKQLNLALNMAGDWDEEALAKVLGDLYASGADMQLTGFNREETEKYLASLRSPLAEALDDAPAPPVEPIAKPGDVWKLGEHRVACGDACDPAVGRALFGNARASLLITDPPYGVSYVGKTKRALTIKNDALASNKLRALLRAAFLEARGHLAAGAGAYVCTPGGALQSEFQDAFVGAGFEWHQTLVWKKDTIVLGRSDYQFQHELILYGWLPGKHFFIADRTKTSVLEVARPKVNAEHPTMKPLGLWTELMGNSTTGGQLVFDPFLGSGTTVLAAEHLGRKARGIELDPRYVDVAVERWQAATGGKATRVTSGKS